MKKLALFITLFISVCAFAQMEKAIPDRPVPPKLVNDYAHVLTPEQVQSLENKLVAYDDSTSNQIAVVTIKTTGDYDISEFTLGLLRKWGVGGTRNNGIVILAAIDDHKIWIATGYGLEGAVPDITANTIIENDITPNFKQNNFYRGFDNATSSLIKAAAGEYAAPEGYRNRGKGGGSGAGKFFIAVIIFIIILSVLGGGRGGGGGYVSRRGSGWLGPLILGNMLGGGGSGGGGGAGGSW